LPRASTSISPEPSSATATTSFTTALGFASAPSPWSSRTHTTRPRDASTEKSAKR